MDAPLRGALAGTQARPLPLLLHHFSLFFPRLIVGYGADGASVRPFGVLQRAYHAPQEVQAASAARAVRDGRPIPALAAHELQRTVAADAPARSREIYGGIRIADFVVEVPTVVPGTVYR